MELPPGSRPAARRANAVVHGDGEGGVEEPASDGEERAHATAAREDEHDPVGSPVPGFDRQASSEGLDIARGCLCLDAVPPARTGDHRVPRPLVARVGEWGPGHPLKARMDRASKARKQGNVGGVAYRGSACVETKRELQADSFRKPRQLQDRDLGCQASLDPTHRGRREADGMPDDLEAQVAVPASCPELPSGTARRSVGPVVCAVDQALDGTHDRIISGAAHRAINPPRPRRIGACEASGVLDRRMHGVASGRRLEFNATPGAVAPHRRAGRTLNARIGQVQAHNVGQSPPQRKNPAGRPPASAESCIRRNPPPWPRPPAARRRAAGPECRDPNHRHGPPRRQRPPDMPRRAPLGRAPVVGMRGRRTGQKTR